MKKGIKTKTKRIVQPEEPIVCQFCGGMGYIELDKVGILISPCYNCEKGRAQAELMGAPIEELPYVGDNRTEPIDSGTQQPDNFTGSRDSS